MLAPPVGGHSMRTTDPPFVRSRTAAVTHAKKKQELGGQPLSCFRPWPCPCLSLLSPGLRFGNDHACLRAVDTYICTSTSMLHFRRVSSSYVSAKDPCLAASFCTTSTHPTLFSVTPKCIEHGVIPAFAAAHTQVAPSKPPRGANAGLPRAADVDVPWSGTIRMRTQISACQNEVGCCA